MEWTLKFSELSLDSRLQQAIQKLGYEETTPIQEQAMPHILEGRDLAGLAQTGTGKTAAFLLPLMERILRSIPSDHVVTPEEREKTHQRVFKDWQARNLILVLVPTRELADQVYENLVTLSEFCGIKGVCIYGGTGYDKQREGLRNGPQFIIATPGRLMDLYKEHDVDLKQVRAIVFDEADRMFDMGFKDDMVYILHRVPRDRQLLVFSATLNFEVLNTAYQFGSEPVEINISRDQAKAENVKDVLYHVGNDEKAQYILSVIKMQDPKQTIIFTNFKTNVERIARFLNDNGVQAMAISSLLSQAQRTRVMQQFKADNTMNILVATDVAARGLDVQGVDLVINYELPNDPESYIHRIGRTGRAGASGHAVSLVSDKDVESLMRIEEFLKHKVDVSFMEDSGLVKDFKPMAYEQFHFRGSSDGGGGNRDRGPRQRRDSRGGGGDRNRGPRSGPPRDRNSGEGRPDRGPRRPENAAEGRSHHRPQRSHSSRDGKDGVSAGVSAGAAASVGPNGNGQQPQGRRGPPRGDRKRFDNRDNRQGGGNGADRNRPPRQHSGAKSTTSKAPAQVGLSAKVKGFFKRLLS
jgi:superfamily II DNA/RNA helicase